MKRSQESSSLNSLWRWKQAHVVSSRGTAYLWDKNLQVNLKIGRVQHTLKWEHGKRDVWTPNVFSVQRPSRNRELRMVQKIFKLSLRDACLGKPRSTNKRSFNTSNVGSRCKGDNGKGMKGGHKEGTKKQEVREVHYIALIDVRHNQKYEYIPENSRKSNLKCGNDQAQMKELYTNFQRRSKKQEWGQKI